MRFDSSRRQLLATGAFAALAGGLPAITFARTPSRLPARATALPLSDVRLLPSRFADAVTVNRRYLLSLDSGRLLHNFYTSAGLPPKGAVYGGWEGDTIAGHTLGHYLTALALTHAQTGDPESCARAGWIVDELAAIQAKQGDGYVAGFTRKRKDGTIVDGKEIFPEIMAGDIRSAGFDLNGCWVPLYNWHKLFAGLFDAQTLCGNTRALPVAVALGGYIDRVFAALNDDQVQTVLACEHGGINESFAELHARTRDPRWLKLAERLYHRKVLDPLTQRRDELANIHANTQIPKLIGLARLHDITGKAEQAVAPRFFWETVTGHHSYVIGGNADREYFSAPDSISTHITDQTCEHCNSYNMLKLTRMLYGWQPDGALFDYYERTHFNHILAQQHPETGMYTYMTPLMSGARREFSGPTDAFWCCVGSGMESHAKHGESIFWEGADTLFVNLYIPATADWRTRGAALRLDTLYPTDGAATLRFTTLRRPGRFTVALRVPGWATDAAITVNGASVPAERQGGYALVDRRWKTGDSVAIRLPMELRIEPTKDDPDMIALLRGPLVLAADMGPGDADFKNAAPALVGSDILAAFRPVANDPVRFETRGVVRPGDLRFVPFYTQYDRRSAVYFKRFTEAGWKTAEAGFLAEQARLRDLAARSVDVMHLGEMQPERDHTLTSEISYPLAFRGRNGRDARTGGFFEFDLKVRPGPLLLQATYWGDERKRDFDILVDGTRIATQRLDADKPGQFIDITYPIPEALTRGKQKVRIRFQPKTGNTAGPAFGVLMLAGETIPKT